MRHRTISTALLAGYVAVFAFFVCGGAGVQAATMKLQVQLVWGTTNSTSPNPKHKPVEADVRIKLKKGPLKWSNFFEVNRKDVELPPSSTSRISLSEKCQIEIKSLGGSKLAVTLFGKGKETWKGTQPLPEGEMLVVAGNAPNATAWLVVLKRIE